MQAIARELNNSETAFIFSASDGTHDVRVRFFTPTREVPICGHATVSAHYVRAVEGNLPAGRVLQKTGAGILPVDILREGGETRVVMTQGKIETGEPFSEALRKRLAGALGIGAEDLRADCPVLIASTGHSKVMVPIKELARLHALRPDMAALAKLSGEIGCNGFYVFTLHPGETPLIHGRMFAPAIGILEDPVTGNANGPLGAYLVRYGFSSTKDGEFSFEAVQGEAIGRPGRMKVSVKVENGEPMEVKIAGDAVIAFSTTLEL
jgi:PhzF family phenazine biosynthesis protein